MTRWLAAVSLLALTAGVMQARADVLPTEGDAPPCGASGGAICEERTVQRCTEWRGVEFQLQGSDRSFSVGYRIECAKWETTTTKTYYPA
ncbi:MAG TPA: hypothetical protein VK922_02070 [Gemmatimonadaceae bacterium]|nr:hypothetical protein [Gemmatimonadaceae bacterium]